MITLLVPVAVALLVPPLFYYRVMSGGAAARNRGRAMRWRIRFGFQPGPGFASFPELVFRWGRLPAIHHGRRGRPGTSWSRRVRTRTTNFAVRFGRGPYARRCYGRMEDMVGVLAPQRSGKTGMLIDRILDHPGAVITSSSRADVYFASAVSRSRRGPVEVFNPLGIGGVVSTFSWDLIGACTDEMAANRMADWLAGATPGYGNVEWFEIKGTFALGALLLAAHQGGHSITDVYWWVHSGSPQACPAIPILNARGNKDLAQVVIRLLQNDRTAGSVRDTIDKTLQWAAMPPLARAATRHSEFDHLGLVMECGTLYLITSGDSRSLITPLIRALASWVHFEAGNVGSRLPAGKLDPPLLMALDEVSITCPIALPDMMSDSAGKGLLIEWIAHSFSQLEERWGKYGARTIMNTSGVLILLGGSKDDEVLALASKLSGEIDAGGKMVPVMPADVLRTLPDLRALVVRTNRLPVVVKLRPYWHRLAYRWPLKYRQALPVPSAALPVTPWLDVPEAADLAARAEAEPAAEVNGHSNGHGNGHSRPAWIPDQRSGA